MAVEKPILEILTSIDKGEYLMPEFQRGYVWNANQIKGFIRSLYLNYPTGSFLIWKTETPSEIRGGNANNNLIYKNLILDGQQRLTTIYTIFKGETPDWYEGVALRTDLYFNLNKEEFQYYQPKEMEGKPEWIHVSNYLVNGGLGNFMGQIATFPDDARNYYVQPHIIERLTQLGAVLNYGYYIKEISLDSVEKVVEIFNLVNKSGTTLRGDDLALAIITSTWSNTKERFRKQIQKYKKHNYHLDFNFFTRTLNMIITNRGRYTSEIGKKENEDFNLAWDKMNKSLSYLINILREDAYIDSNNNLSSVYVLYTLVYFLAMQDNKFNDEAEKKKAIYWLFMAQLWGWYSGSSESYLEKDLSVIKQGQGIDGLIENLSLFRGNNLYLTPEDMAYQGVRSKIWPLFYAAVRANDAKDWTDINVPLYSRNIGYNNVLQRHHIFPKSYLYNKYSSSNRLERNMVNEIANKALVTHKSNMKIFVTSPEEYLPMIPQEQLRKQFVPLDKTLYKLEKFELFLEKRRRLIADGINTFLRSYYEYKTEGIIASDLQHSNEAIERIELKIRDLINDVLIEAAEQSAYEEFVPSHTQQQLKEKIDRYLAKNPGENPEEYKQFRKILDFFDINEYKIVITNKTNWKYFESYFGKKGTLENKFHQLGELRNCIRHSREVNEVILKEGEAAIAWFESVLLTS